MFYSILLLINVENSNSYIMYYGQQKKGNYAVMKNLIADTKTWRLSRAITQLSFRSNELRQQTIANYKLLEKKPQLDPYIVAQDSSSEEISRYRDHVKFNIPSRNWTWTRQWADSQEVWQAVPVVEVGKEVTVGGGSWKGGRKRRLVDRAGERWERIG